MMKKSTTLIVLLLAIAYAALATNVTFAPPPEVVPRTLFSFNESRQDGRLLWSPALEVLNLDNFTLGNGSVATNITLTVYNRTENNSNTKYRIGNLLGNWSLITSTVKDFSCSVIYESNSQLGALLRFSRAEASFRVVGIININLITGQNNTPPAFIQQVLRVGEDCEVAGYRDPTNNAVTVYRANFQTQTLFQVTTPVNWNPIVVSDDLRYAISNGVLYGYDSVSFSYVALRTLTQPLNYTIISSRRRVILWGTSVNVVDNATGALSVNMTVQVFIWGTSGLVQIGGETVTGHREINPNGAWTTLKVWTSPELSKYGYGYDQGSGLVIVAKSVNYLTNTITTGSFNDPVRYLQTVMAIDPYKELDFNDWFLVARNSTQSALITDPAILEAANPVETAWQFIGSNFTYLRTRPLWNDTVLVPGTNSSREFASFKKTFIDPSVKDRCVVLNVYGTPMTGYQLVAFDYGSVQSNFRIETPPTPSYIDFAFPVGSYGNYSTKTIREWAFMQTTNAGADTNITVFTVDNNTNAHYRNVSYTLTGNNWKVAADSKACKLLVDSTNSPASIKLVAEVNGSYVTRPDFTPLLANLTTTANSIWAVSEDCSRARVDNLFVFQPQGGSWTAITSPADFRVFAVDRNLTYATGADSTIWRVNPANNSFVKVHTFETVLGVPRNMSILSQGNKIVAWWSNAQNAVVRAFEDSGPQLNYCLNYTELNFTLRPQIMISPNLTKVLIAGNVSRVNFTGAWASAYHIACPKSQNISFPMEFLGNPNNTIIDLSDNYVHVSSMLPPTAVLEALYFFKDSSVPLKVLDRVINYTNTARFVRSNIWQSPNGTALLTEWVTTMNHIVVNATVINPEQAVFNSQNNGDFTAEVKDGKIKVCPTGCKDCACTGCLSSFALDTATQKCRPCAPGCLVCDYANNNNCSSCVDGAYLTNYSTCAKCSPQCEQCTGSPNSCLGCPPGEFPNNGSCAQCPKNCFNCSSSTVCITCRKGFTVTPTGLCRGCSASCSDCNPDNITECTACGDSLYLYDGKCLQCPSNCKGCASSTSCSVCFQGFTPSATTGLCVQECQLPCLTCLDNQPTMCLSCPYGSDHNTATHKCDPLFACNATSSCTDCGYGTNYYLTASAQCTACPAIDFCIQCDPASPDTSCAICKPRYFLNSSQLCEACHSNCTSCSSYDICKSCAPGWTLKTGQTEGQCRACISPCATCSGNPQYCTSCIDGFTRNGWHCKNNTNTGFRLVLQSTPTVILGDIDSIVCKLLAMLNGQNPTNVSSDCDKAQVTLETVAAASVVVSGSSSSGSAANLQSGLSSGSLGYTVLDSSVTENGASSSSSSEEKSKIGLIVGLAVGLSVLVVVVVVIIVCIKKRSAIREVTPSEDGAIIMVSPVKADMQESGLDVAGGLNSNDVYEKE